MNELAKMMLTRFLLLICFSTLIGCSQQDSGKGTAPSGVASVGVTIGFAASNALSAPRAPLGTVNEVVSVTVDVYDNATALVTGQTMTVAGGVWSTSINNLPINKALTFRGHAYNGSSTEIFAGTTVQTLSGTNDSVVINMVVIDNGVATVLPKISSITVPAQVVTSGTATLAVSVEGGSNETLTYALTAATDGGTFTPSSGTILLSGSAATLSIGYTAPVSAGTYTHSLILTNSQGNIVETTFTTTVVVSIANGTATVQFSPVVTRLSAKRTGTDVVWTATAVDDGPAGELRYAWSFNGGLSFFDSTVNPATLQGYSQTASGTLALTVKDHNGSGGSTTITYVLPSGQFPDSLVITQTTTTGGAYTPSLKVPDTGQTMFYSFIYGDDSDYALNPVSCTDNGNGTITDNVTGLVWQKMDNAFGTLNDANAYCGGLNLGGYSTGWRLPSAFELQSIVSYGTYSPAVDITYFPNTRSTPYWSSDIFSIPSPTIPSLLVNFTNGAVEQTDPNTIPSMYIRCVHGAQAIQALTDNGNGTVTDQTTKLMWQQQDNGTQITWESAISYCEGLSLGGFTDWRAPNVKELNSLMDRSKNPPLNADFFTSSFTPQNLWSSTTDASQTTNAWGYFGSAFVEPYDKSSIGMPGMGNTVRCVRAGTSGLAPVKPTGVAATAGSAGSGEITVSWNTAPGAASYRVYCGTASGVTKQHWFPGNSITTNSVSLGFLNPGATEYCVVTAVNENGESDESIQVWAVVP